MADEFQEFIGAVAEDEIGRGDLEFGGEFLLEIKGVAIRVEVGLGQGPAHRRHRQGRRAKRVFVGGELEDVLGGQPEFARDFFDGPSGLVNREV